MKPDASLDSFVFHDDRSGDIAGKTGHSRKDVATANLDEIGHAGVRDQSPKGTSDGGTMFAKPYV
jgi:hypothetical protein